MNEKVEFPIFELAGETCKEPNCNGILVLHLDLKTKQIYHQCSICLKKAK